MSSPTGSRAANLEAHEEDLEALADAFLQLKTREEFKRFMSDLCTPNEMIMFANRWKAVRLLDVEPHIPQRKIAEITRMSVTTVGRVARYLRQESYQGYRLVLNRLKNYTPGSS